MDIRIAGFNDNSIVDGIGVRYTVYLQGCKHNCNGCHNPETHDFNGGVLMNTQDIVSDFSKYKWFDGITLSGGDPFFQPVAAKELADKTHELNKTVWCYTGYTIEQIMNTGTEEMKSLLNSIDILVDGKFDLSKKTLNKRFIGSSNQRIIDVKQTMSTGNIVLKEV